MFYNIMFETFESIDNFKHVGKLFQILGVKWNVFWSEHVLLDKCFSFKYGGQFSLKNLKALEQMY